MPRAVFFREDEWVMQFMPPAQWLDPPGVVPELIVHLWARRSWEGVIKPPPDFLLECYKRPRQ